VRGSQLSFDFLVAAVAQPCEAPASHRGADCNLPLLARARAHLTELGLDRLARAVEIRWNPRMRSTAGRATWPDALVELNPALHKVGEGEILRTLLHELAHLVAYERAGRRRIRPHGAEWQQACVDLGIPGESASHRLNLPSRSMRKKWLYVCPRCQARVERVKRMARYSACWPCCRQFSAGKYDGRFRFAERRLGSN
jgi:predicted SprT family Zn-dependent metalloprotease